MPRSLVIVNPNASRLRDPRVRASLVERLRTVLEHGDGAKPEVVVTKGPGDTRPAVEAALADGVASVIGVGGDGTQRDIAAVLNGSAALPGSSAALGIVPAGTSNQLAAVLGVPLSLESAADALLRTRRRRIDLGRATLRLSDGSVREDIFTIGCGVGFDALIMATTPETWKRRLGRTAYFLQALKLAMSIEALPYRLTIDGRTIDTEASIALVGNMGQLVPGRLDLRLPIVPDDGLLDVIVVGARGPFHGLMGLADQFLRTSLGGTSGSASLRLRGRVIAIAPDRPQPLEVDGDHVGTGSLEAHVLPGAIDVLVPDTAPRQPDTSALG